MRELVINQPSKRILLMIQKMVARIWKRNSLRNIDDDEDKLYYQYLQKGTYTVCILTINNEIVGIGMTKRSRDDKYNVKTAVNVSTWKAVKDYLQEIKPEYKQLEE